jgi:hypothetical protein
MKHITRYKDWTRAFESEGDQEIEDLGRLVDLGLAEPDELKAMHRQKYAVPRREEFLQRLGEMFRELDIQPKDYTTPRQQRNGTYFFQLTPAQVEKILFGYPLPQGLAPKQESRMRRMLGDIESVREKLRARDEIETWESGPYGRQLLVNSSRYQYFVYPADLRGAAFHKQPNSSGHFKFDGLQSADAMLARFIYQLALDTHSWAVYTLDYLSE